MSPDGPGRTAPGSSQEASRPSVLPEQVLPEMRKSSAEAESTSSVYAEPRCSRLDPVLVTVTVRAEPIVLAAWPGNAPGSVRPAMVPTAPVRVTTSVRALLVQSLASSLFSPAP